MLTAKPKFFIYKFSGWSGAAAGNQSSISITLNAPASLTASYAINWIPIGIIFVVLVVIIVGLILFLLRRRRPKVQPEAPVPPMPQ